MIVLAVVHSIPFRSPRNVVWFPKPGRMPGVDELAEILERARSGDPEALETFVRRTQRDVFAVCRNLGDVDTVEDLVQDTYARAIRSIDSYRGDGPARNWLLTIARRTCADATRKRIIRRRHRADPPSDEIPHLDADLTAVDELLAILDDDRRDAFVLTQLTGCSYGDAADILGCPIGTVRSRVARARHDLLDELESRDRQEPGAGSSLA